MNNIIKKNSSLLPALMKEVEDKIVVVRAQRTLLDRDVAALYGVETKRVNEAVKNNPRKFREGYVIELTKEESDALRSKISTIEAPVPTLEPVNGKGREGLEVISTVTSLEKAYIGLNYYIGMNTLLMLNISQYTMIAKN